MKYLLTSAGISNDSIRHALVDLLGKPIADEHALRALLTRYPAFAQRRLPIIIQPQGDTAIQDYLSALEHLATRSHNPFWDTYNVRILPQMHLIIWGRKRWV